jgi:moderate conductance mechanosensitive channel
VGFLDARRWLLAFLFAAVLTAHAAVPVWAKEASRENLAAPQIESLIKTLEDDERRARLVGDLRILLDAAYTQANDSPKATPGVLDDLSRRVGRISQNIVAAAASVLDAPAILSWTRATFGDPARRNDLFAVIAHIASFLLAGLIAEGALRLALRGPRGRVEARSEDGMGATLVFLLARTILDLVPIAGFAAASYGAVALLDPGPAVRLGALALINASVLARAVVAVARMVVAPRIASLRVLPIGDIAANYVFIWIRRLANLTIYGAFAVQSALLLGLPLPAYELLLKLLGLAIGALFVMLVMQNRQPVAQWIRGEDAAVLSSFRRRFADIWHVLLILYLVVSFSVWALELPGGFEFILRASLLSIVIVVAAKLVLIAAGQFTARTFRLNDDVKARLPELEARVNRYLPLLEKAGRIFLILFAGLGVLQAWGVDILSWAASASGRGVVGSVATIAIIVVLAFAAWEVVSALIERYLAAKDSGGDAVARSQRVRTLLPLLRNVFMVALTVMAVLTVLSELGIDIGPLLAGAGVVGLAVGFGAQTLVKDIITGLFILLEDSISVGDVVDVAGHSGVVETLTIRTIRLRDVQGTVHTVPFSEVSSVKNLTKDFSYALMEIGIAYREDVDDVIGVIQDVGAVLRTDEALAEAILEDIQVQGLDRFDDSAVVIRARIKTKPLRQWAVRRAFNKALKRRFDELGIEMPFPHQTIYFGEDKTGAAPAAPVRLVREPLRPKTAASPQSSSSPSKSQGPSSDDFITDTMDGDEG